jgi:hypothetical protein
MRIAGERAEVQMLSVKKDASEGVCQKCRMEFRIHSVGRLDDQVLILY